MEFNDWILCRELVLRINAIVIPFALNKEETRILNAIDRASQISGKKYHGWSGFEDAFWVETNGR